MTGLSQRGVRILPLLVFLLSGCESRISQVQNFPFSLVSLTMGTSYSIKVSKMPEAVDEKNLKDEIENKLAHINALMSTYMPDSELSKFNSSLSTEWQPVSEELFFVLTQAEKISRLTEGAFDITVGPLVNLWGFGPDLKIYQKPSQQEIDQRRQFVGFQNVELDPAQKKIRKIKPEIYIDLSAIAKGYAVDQVAEILEGHAIRDFMVEIGGELRLKGNNLSNSPWRIAVEKPTAEQRMVQRIFPISDTAMATSGDYRNFFEQDGQRFSHTIDPRTANPITHTLASVTVLRPTSIEADALATAFMVLGPETGYQLAEKEHIAALFIVKTKTGFAERSTPVFQEKFEVQS